MTMRLFIKQFNKDANSKYLLLLIIIIAILFRVRGLSIVPTSLFGDELDVGYQALSILKTGKDYTGNFMPLHFQSLAEWRTPLYLYFSVPSIALFGISSLGVRLPAVLFGVVGVLFTYLLVKEITQNKVIALLSSLILAISPWHIGYSRAAFEVTQLYAFYAAGIYFFIKGLKDNKLLIPASILLGFTPWIYNTAKLYLPLTVIALVIIFWGDIKKVSRKYLFVSVAIFALITIPFMYDTFLGGGSERFEGISIFSNPSIDYEIGMERERDVLMSGNDSLTLFTRATHNKYIYLAESFVDNYLKSLSFEFLFSTGDVNPRHNSSGFGQLYLFQLVLSVVGIFCLIRSRISNKYKYLVLFWLITASIPSALTKDGGNHATRLFILLLPLTMLSAMGLYYIVKSTKGLWRGVVVIIIITVVSVSIVSYQHYYWTHYPWDSENWWHTGYEETIESVVSVENEYDKIIISSYNEPSLKFFVAWSEYSPKKFQDEYGTMEDLEYFGSSYKLDKYYFPPTGSGHSIYDIGSLLNDDVLYVASGKEIGLDLNSEPERIPNDVTIVNTIFYSSGSPAFYLIEKKVVK